jgi:DNA-binding NarL/FixJ family response regulator
MKTRILLADDHPFLIIGLRSLLKSRFEIVGAAADGKTLLDLALDLRPDIVITDMSMPIMNGLEVTRRLREADAKIKIIFLTMHSDVDLIREAFDVGASGYVLKSCAVEDLAAAIRSVSEGKRFLTASLAKGRLESMNSTTQALPEAGSVRLTSRERQVLQLVAEGRIMKEIAALLGISVRTAGFHRYNIMDKLQLRSTAELTQYAIRRNLVCLSSARTLCPLEAPPTTLKQKERKANS